MHSFPDGTHLPHIGFATYPLRGEDGIRAIVSALEAGYRYLDTAVNYENEEEVGEALRRSGIGREQVLIATKIPGRAHERASAIATVQESLDRLQVDCLDVVLVHWPNPSRGHYVEAYEALLECRDRGLVSHVGTSNYAAPHLDEVISASGRAPVLNQIECHPLSRRRSWSARTVNWVCSPRHGALSASDRRSMPLPPSHTQPSGQGSHPPR
ncbi:aldo/keto reductase [Ornithinimicrobium ciconiae]|uniref:aldo/keto reductase n=1 Tax=Ornithinimicrobium ciconiae TaxID=2594265 RepID=UPI002AA29B75|nr:aldo/keto reductase [Ornithinimicrobium ciconiae]